LDVGALVSIRGAGRVKISRFLGVRLWMYSMCLCNTNLECDALACRLELDYEI